MAQSSSVSTIIFEDQFEVIKKGLSLKSLYKGLLCSLVLFIANGSSAQTAVSGKQFTCTMESTFDGDISPSAIDFLKRLQNRAIKKKCDSILINFGLSGKNFPLAKKMADLISNSSVPHLCFMSSETTKVSEFGAFVLQACQVSGGVPTASVGTELPLVIKIPTAEENPQDLAVSEIEVWGSELAERRGHDVAIAKEMILAGKMFTAKDATEAKIIDWSGESKKDFIEFSKEKKISVGNEIINYKKDFRYQLMAAIVVPIPTYIIWMISLGLLYCAFAVTSFSALTVFFGTLGILSSLVSMYILDVTWGGVFLMLLGIAFLITEAFVVSFGILSIGGILSFFIGSFFLFDANVTGHSLPLNVIWPTTIAVSILILMVGYFSYNKKKKQTASGTSGFVGKFGRVTEVQMGDGKFGYIEVAGEIWKCTSDAPLKFNQKVRVTSARGLTLHVESSIENY